MEKDAFLIVGLGNKGKEYDNTLHNMGFKAIDMFAKQYNLVFSKTKCKSLIAEDFFNGKKVVLAKPQTYMNRSGISVNELVKKYGFKTKNILVIYDDFDVEVGEVRLRTSGSAGTHNGMRDIVSHIGTDFPRVRIGIKNEKNKDLKDIVLGKIQKKDVLSFEKSFEKSVEIIEEFILKDGQVENTKFKVN